jgi:hypothetical protein
MFVGPTEELDRQGVRLVIAGDVGRVRDVLRRTSDGEGAQRFRPTVAAAIADLNAGA